MKRFRFWLMAALVMVLAVLAASCDGAGGTAGEPEHQHSFEYGSCRECGEADPGVNFSFSLNEDGETYTLTKGSYWMPDGAERSHVIVVPRTYRGCPVVGIGEKAFYELNLEEVTLPDGLKTIGNAAFMRCRKLEKAAIPETVTTIGNSAFESCERLTEIHIPGSVREIGAYAFHFCGLVKTLTIDDGVRKIGEYAFASCGWMRNSMGAVSVPASVSEIGAGAFVSCTMTSLTVNGNGECLIGSRAFSGCKSLETAVIGDGIVGIGERAFEMSPALKTVTIGNGVKSIGKEAFFRSGMLYAEFGGNLQTISDNAFAGCYRLTAAALPDSLRSIGKEAFDSCIHLSSVTLGSGLRDIGKIAFYGCKQLLEVINRSALPLTAGSEDYGLVACYARTIRAEAGDRPYFVTTADGYRFYEDDEVSYLIQYVGTETELILPERSPSGRAYAVYGQAFSGLPITAATIPAEVTEIGQFAFSECESLSSLTFVCTDGWHKVYQEEDTAIDVSDPAANVGKVLGMNGRYVLVRR